MTRKIALYGTSLNPPGIHHRKIAEELTRQFDIKRIVPCGPRPEKLVTNDIEPIHRAFMADLAFRGMPNLVVDLFDLENSVFTRTHELEKIYSPEGEVWIVIGSEFIRGGREKESFIHREWHKGKELWENSRFAILTQNGHSINKADFPPHAKIISVSAPGSSSVIRNNVFNHKHYDDLVSPDIGAYIERHGLYRGGGVVREPTMKIKEPRALIIADQRNTTAMALKDMLGDIEDHHTPNCIIVIGGDGTMLGAIRENWRLRLPTIGINAGHVGFLLNDVGSDFPSKFFDQTFDVRFSRLLHVEVMTPDGTVKKALAFNEAALQVARTATDPANGGLIAVEINGEMRLPTLMADGIFVASVAGSTAYAQAAGAHPLPLGTNNLVVQGLAAYSPLNWGENIPLDSTVVLRNADKSRWRKLLGYCDSKPLGEVVEMRVRSSHIAAVEILTGKNYSLPAKLDKARNQYRNWQKERR